MTDQEYVEPTNEQLASFLMIYADQIDMGHLDLDKDTLKKLMDSNPRFREGALRHHRGFQKQINDLTRKIMAGELQCYYVRGNGKRCPNYNEPGLMYCGLHKDAD